jgi:hypothetical protein
MAVMIQQNQYVHPQKNPAQGPSRSVEKSMKDLYARLDNNSSPIARMTKRPTIEDAGLFDYTRQTGAEGRRPRRLHLANAT